MTQARSGALADGMLHLLPYFIEQTRGRLAQIETHRQVIADRQDAKAAMKAIGDIAHQISGTADTFGFADLGTLARRIEALDFGAQPIPDAPAMVGAVADLIQEMLKIVALHPTAPAPKVTRPAGHNPD